MDNTRSRRPTRLLALAVAGLAAVSLTAGASSLALFTGTAAEITPIRSVDKISVGKGTIGPVTKAIQKEFYAIVQGEKSDRHNWLTPVPVKSKQPVGV